MGGPVHSTFFSWLRENEVDAPNALNEVGALKGAFGAPDRTKPKPKPKPKPDQSCFLGVNY